MPVTDFNSEKALGESFNLVYATEQTTAFWDANSQFISLLLTFVILMICASAVFLVLIFIFHKIKKT